MNYFFEKITLLPLPLFSIPSLALAHAPAYLLARPSELTPIIRSYVQARKEVGRAQQGHAGSPRPQRDSPTQAWDKTSSQGWAEPA